MQTDGMFKSTEVQAFVLGPLFDLETLNSRDPSYPRISVVVPSYNQGVFLERTLLSILNQNYPNLELIVIDGGSDDDSVEVVRRYERHIDHWVSESDDGQPSAINRGFARVTGDLVAWQNSDDLYLPGIFHTVAASYRSEPRAELLIGNVYLIDEFDSITGAARFAPFSVGHLMYWGWNLSSQAAFVRRDVVQRVGPMREDIQVGFDWDWYIRVGKVVKRCVLHRRFSGCYRIHPRSKLSVHPRESRWSINAQILQSHGIRIREDLPYERQWPWRRRFQRWKHILFLGLLYFPVNRWGEIERVPFPSVSYRLISMMRPLVLQALSRVGKTRIV